MGLLSRKKVLLAKIESSYATDATPAGATDAVLVRSCNVSPLEQDYADRELVRPYLGNFEKLPTNKQVKLECEMEIAGFGSAGPATPTAGYGALLRACGLSQTVTAGTKVVYAPISTGFESVTIYYYQDGTLHKLLGCRGNVVMTLNDDAIPVYKFTIMGTYGGVTDTALASPTVSAFVRPVVVNQANTTALSIQGFTTARLKSLEINLGNDVRFRSLVGGIDEVLIVDRKTEGSLEIEATTVAAKDWWAAITGATLAAFSVTHGPATNQVKLDSTRLQLTEPQFNEEDGIIMMPMKMLFVPSTAGNDELTITVQ